MDIGDVEGLTPCFCLQSSLKDISQKLKQYRPSATVLEAEVAPARRGEGAGGLAGPGMTASTAPGDFNEVMRLKRLTHDATIKVTLPPTVSSGSMQPTLTCDMILENRRDDIQLARSVDPLALAHSCHVGEGCRCC